MQLVGIVGRLPIRQSFLVILYRTWAFAPGMNRASFRFRERFILCFSGANFGWGLLVLCSPLWYTVYINLSSARTGAVNGWPKRWPRPRRERTEALERRGSESICSCNKQHQTRPKVPLELLVQSSGPRGRGFKSRHSDHKSSDFRWNQEIFLNFRSILFGWILSSSVPTQTRPRPENFEEVPGADPGTSSFFFGFFTPFVGPWSCPFSGLPPFAFPRWRGCRCPV